MANMEGFDATNIDPDKPREVMPKGKYPAIIEGSDVKATKAGDGKYLALELTVIGNEYKGNKLYANLNIKNPNAKTVEIAEAQLSAICHAFGILKPRDSMELHGKPILVSVDTEEYKGKLKNVVNGFSPVSAVAAPTETANGGQPGAEKAPASASAAPWA